MFDILCAKSGIVSGLLFILFCWGFGEFDVDFGVFFLSVGFSFKGFGVIFDDMCLFESDDHGEAGDSSVDGVGDFQSIVETVEGAAEVEVLVSFLTEQSVTEDSHSDGLVSSF